MPVPFTDLLADLAAETEVLDAILADLPAGGYERPTPAVGWAVRDQVSHLAYFDETATLAAEDPGRFRAEAAELMALGDAFPDVVAARHRQLSAPVLLDWFRGARKRLLDVFGTVDPKTRVPWYGPDMSIASSVTARLMETWAHGQDVADALGVRREPTHRLRHVAHLGVRTLGFTFRLHGREVPTDPVRVELTAPDGGVWAWGPEDARDAVRGTALDFCLAVTQRRHLDDLSLDVVGPVATEWMSIAQAYAGAPGPGRASMGRGA